MSASRLIIVLILCFAPFNAIAADINDEGAAKLKNVINTFVDNQKMGITASGQKITQDGDIVIEQKSNYYAVTLPNYIVTTTNKSKQKIGRIKINATPMDAKNWNMSVQLPTVYFLNAKTNKESKLHADKQDIKGTWNDELRTFSTLSAKLGDIIYSADNGGTFLKINNIEISSNYKKNADNTWDGPFALSMDKLLIPASARSFLNKNKADDAVANNENVLQIESIKMNANTKNYDPQKFFALTDKIKDQASAPNVLAIIKSLGGYGSATIALKNIQANFPDKKGANDNKMALDYAYANSNFMTEKNETISTGFKFGFSGLSTSDKNSKYAPKNMNVDVAFNNIPLQKLLESSLAKTLQSKDANAKGMMAMQAMMTLPQMLAEAGTSIKINDTKAANDLYGFDMKADFKANPNSMIGVTGTLNSAIKGMDNIINDLKESRTDTNASRIDDMIKKLETFRLISDQKGDQNLYNLELTEDAKILVNGKDVSGLIMGGRK